MLKKLIAKILLIAVMSSNFSTGVFASVNNNIVNKDSTENLKIYRKTSLSPGEEGKKFNIPFHSNEPLGIEILEDTEVEILIEGEDVYGSANVNLHDVGNLRGIQRVNVGEKTTVKIPRKGQLYLDVAGVKLKSDNPSDDFSFDVKLKLNGQDYEVSPIFDIRENKISDKVILDPEEFKAKAFSEDNKEDSAILISENTRVHIPVSKYLPAHFDPQISAEAHEAVVTNFNKWSGLDENNENPLNRPRENFVLASARNEQGGFMSAGGTMLDTHTKNIYAYLGRPKLDSMWGMYHEYGHLYEQGWGFGEYWNNMFANALSRIDLDNPEWAWVYGNESSGYESNSLLPSYKKYLTTGETGSIHPMYFFLSFIDHMDSEFMAKLSTYWRENQLSYYGWDYVAYFIAKEYKLNVIPYIEATGELGYSVVNKDVIDEIMESSDRLFMYMPEDEKFDEVRNLSIQPTIKSIYSGKNRVLKGMSNPNADIVVNVEGNEYRAKANETGKFEVTITEDIRIDSNITITSKEEGKKVSFNKKVTVEDKNTSISFRGFKSEEFLSLDFDRENKKFKAISSGNIANKFCSGNYIKIEQYNKKGTLKNRFTVNANGNADEVAAKLNDTSYTEGDYIKLYHQEQQGRLIINGEVLNAPYYLDTGVRNMNLNNTYFYILDGNLVYSENILDLEENRDDLNELIESSSYNEELYTKTTFANYQNALDIAKSIVTDETVSDEEIAATYGILESAIKNLRKKNIVEFKGYNNNKFLTLKFDTDNKKILAETTGEQVHPFHGSYVYGQVKHYDKKGNEKGVYSVRANETGEKIATELNNLQYSEGDYLKFYHREQNGRLVVNGYVTNTPANLENGVGNLNLENSLFYLNGESFEYSDSQLDLSANKDDLIAKVADAKKIDATNYTVSSFDNLQNAISNAEALINSTNVLEEEIVLEIENLTRAIEELREVNKIDFMGYNNETFLQLEFDNVNKKFVAKSNGKIIHPYQYSREYAKVEHFNKKGELKGSYSAFANKTADEMAEGLNQANFVDGDYIKISHLEQNGRLKINGYVEDAPQDLSQGALGLDLNKSYFYFEGESLRYTSTQLDLSADKNGLVSKIEEAKKITGDNYTKESYKNLLTAIAKGDELVNTPNLFEEEIAKEIENIQNAIEALRELNEIIFKGYNNNEFLKVSFDSETKQLKAVSNGQAANPYIGGKYAEITHHDKKGNVKGRYSLNGGQTANEIANQINNLEYSDGDFIKLYHAEKNHRLVIKGYVENSPYDLSTGAVNLDLNNSLFYLNGESLEYSIKQLDLSANKEALFTKIEEAKKLDGSKYTKVSFENLQDVIANAEVLVNQSNLYEEEIVEEILKITKAIESLKEVNKIDFMGYNNEIFLSVEFDNINKRFIATSNGKMVHPYQYSREYAKIVHFDQKGNVKGEYKSIANQTADEMANGLNNATFIDGDYIKISHLEQNSRLRINGYVKDAPYDLNEGGYGLDLGNSYFYFDGESLRFSNSQLDLSADKSELISKVSEVKAIGGENYTKGSYRMLQEAINNAELIISQTNIYEAEISSEIIKLNEAVENLREVNVVEFKGFNNEVFMRLEFDSNNKRFIATSNGNTIHPYHYSREYARVEHYDKNGVLKESFSAYANGTADEMANRLNNSSYEEGDYIKFYHLEQGNRLAIKGYINNFNGDITNGVGNLDLNNSKFNLDDESLTYMN